VSAISGVLRSEPNLTTGSLVVHYDPQQTSHTEIMQSLRSRGYGADQHHPAPQTVAVAAVARVNKPRKAVSPIANKLARQAAEIVVMHVLETAVKRSVPFLLKRSVPFLVTALL
jgi:cation transport ATPase